jgi:hypothetical protein
MLQAGKVAGSIPNDVIGIFKRPNSSSRAITVGLLRL